MGQTYGSSDVESSLPSSFASSFRKATGSSSGRASDLISWTPAKRWEAAFGSKPLRISESLGGRVGLSNLRNTCFMNAGLQCLSHLEPVMAYFLTGKYQEELNANNPMGSGGKLVQAFAKLQEQLWQTGSRHHSPKALHSTLMRFAPHLFEGYEQQDAQEFLAYLLDGLHEDINLVRQRPKPQNTGRSEEEEDEYLRQLEQEKGEEYVAALAWLHHLQRQKSFFVDLFQGQLRSRVRCSRCGCESKTFDPYLYMSIPVHDRMENLEDALRLFLAEETLTGSERWKCPKCKGRVDATKKIDVWKLPPVLVVHLKRFEFDQRTRRFQKINADLQSPLTIDLSKFVAGSQEPEIYDVVGVCNHSGSYGGGHYTATCQSPVDLRFYHFDDDHVEELRDERRVLSSRSYVLFLVRNSRSRDDDDSLSRQSVSHPELWPHSVSGRNSEMLSAVREAQQS